MRLVRLKLAAILVLGPLGALAPRPGWGGCMTNSSRCRWVTAGGRACRSGRPDQAVSPLSPYGPPGPR